MPDTCPHCDEEIDPQERGSRQAAAALADHLIEHPEDLELAAVQLQVAVVREQIEALTSEMHQHWS